MLEISEEEAHGLWSLLAAIYHLGNASVKKSKPSTIIIHGYTRTDNYYHVCVHVQILLVIT